MRNVRHSSGILAVAILALPCTPAWASFSGFASSTAFGFLQNLSTTDSQFALVTEAENLVGGHGYAEISLNFGNGVVTGRNHACVGPTSPTASDSAKGECSAFTSNENLTVTSDTLPVGTPVTIRFCIDMSSEITGKAEPKALVGASESTTEMTFAALGGSVNGRHDTDQFWENIDGANAFAGQDTELANFRGGRTVQAKVGDVFSLSISASSTTIASSSSAPGFFPIADGSAGFAMTFGLDSITDGAKLTWNGATWMGSCDPSGDLIPDNPVPGPASAIILIAGAPGLIRRRR